MEGTAPFYRSVLGAVYLSSPKTNPTIFIGAYLALVCIEE